MGLKYNIRGGKMIKIFDTVVKLLEYLKAENIAPNRVYRINELDSGRVTLWLDVDESTKRELEQEN